MALSAKRLLSLLVFCPLLFAQSLDLPENLDSGLRDLVTLHRSRPAGMMALDLRGKALANRRLVSDTTNRVLVTLVLDGTVSPVRMRATLAALGGTISAEDAFQPTLLSLFLPLDSVAALATSPGVVSLKLSRKPIQNVGSVTSQGVQIIHSDQVNATGITGQGITIGVLSDSFDTYGGPTQAADDVATGDLPNMGVAEGRPGLKFLSEGLDSTSGATDEGRAMAQIAYDVAPGTALCFASAALGPISFAKNIRRLRTDPACGADILVDDTFYLDEPMFSDGPIAQAIDDAVTSDTLLGRKVAYFSSAGNQAGLGYSSDLRIVPDITARALPTPGITLSGIPARVDTSGGFHNFNPYRDGAPVLYQNITITGSSTAALVLQWDDPFDLTPSGITTDLNILLFDSRGRYLALFGANNFSTDEPVEIADIPPGTYRLALVRTGRGTHLATRVRYVIFPAPDGDATGDYIDSQQSVLYGHAASRNAQAVAAYVFDDGSVPSTFTPSLEPFSSPGPVTIVFDSKGKRLATPEVRYKPDIAAPDNVITTFFAFMEGDDTFFSFPGTSAAAPHAAGGAALLLQAAGGPGSLTNDQIRSKFQASAAARDLDVNFSQAIMASGGAAITVTATGDSSNASASSPNFFHIEYLSTTPGQILTGLTIDLGPVGLNFDPSPQTGLPLTVGAASPGVAITSPKPTERSTVLNLQFSGFTSGLFLNFGIDRDLATINTGGNSADLLAGAKVTATFSSGTPATGIFMNNIGKGYSPFDGFGLIDIPRAIKAN